MSKVLPAVPRVLLGAVFLLAGVAGLLHLIPEEPGLTGPAALYAAGLSGSYLLTLVKLTQLVVGALLLSNRFVPLALTLLAPVLVNITAFHLFYAPSGLPLVFVLVATELWLAWRHRAAFLPMLAAKNVEQPVASPARVPIAH